MRRLSLQTSNELEHIPHVSVIVAAYNQEKYIGRCLRSLINQTFPHADYEIIVVNDGSTDKTEYALTQFCDPQDHLVRVVQNHMNLGLPASLNSGIKVSKGQYIVRVDADDFVNENYITFLKYYLDVNSYADAVACDYLLVDDFENVIQRCHSHEAPIACGIMFRRSHLFDVGLYDEKFLSHEERELRVRFEKRYKIGFLDLPLYRYRRHADNMTNNKDKLHKHELMLEQKHGHL